MKTIRLFPLLAAAALLAAGCEKAETPNEGEGEGEVTVAVESITVDESIKDGIALEEGKTLDLSELVTVLPEDATDKTVTYTIADEKVATVSAAGLITAVAAGNTNITISAGEQSVKLTLTVTAEEKPVAVTSITFSDETLEYDLAEAATAIDLNTLVTVQPEGYTEDIVFESSDPDVASIDENGLMTIKTLSEGITITAKASESNVSDQLTIKVYKIVGDYPRFDGDEKGEQAAIEGETWYWTMTFSGELLTPEKQNLIRGRNNSLTAMIDGRFIVSRDDKTEGDAELKNGTAFCVVGKSAPADQTPYFTIDMGEAKDVNYFRIRNISTHKDDVRVRFKKFTEISGSNDGTDFTPIATNVDFTDIQKDQNTRETDNIVFTDTPVHYRYLRFSFKGTECFGPDTVGQTAQIEEFYLGCNEKIYTE